MDLTWMTKEMRDKLNKRGEIVKNRDFEALFELSDHDDFCIALLEILSNQCNYNPDKLNHCQRTLFLCMQLEDLGQTDGILSFLQEDFSDYTNETVSALHEIGAFKSEELIKQAIELLPENGEWFYEVSDADSKIIMEKLDREFSSYPDGKLNDLYRKYADDHRNEISVML